jgi:hypothetical protein
MTLNRSIRPCSWEQTPIVAKLATHVLCVCRKCDADSVNHSARSHRRIILRAGLGSRARPTAPRYSQNRRRKDRMKATPCAGIGHDVHEIEIRFEAVRQGFSAFPQLRRHSIEAMFWKQAKRVSVNYCLGSR